MKGAIRIPVICKATDNSVKISRRVIPMHSVMLHYPDNAITVAWGRLCRSHLSLPLPRAWLMCISSAPIEKPRSNDEPIKT
jgi:hypothetical protein